MRSLRRPAAFAVAAAVALVPLAAVAAAGPAAADPNDRIESFRSDITLRADATFHVRETIAYTFFGYSHHGIYRYIQVRYAIPGDTTKDRYIRIKHLAVSSPTGAPTKTKVETIGADKVIRVGDPNRTVSGTETYVFDYDVVGAMNTFPSGPELNWDVTGNGWDAPIGRVTAVVDGPAKPTEVACFEGPAGSRLACPVSDIRGSRAQFVSDPLDAHGGLTILVGYPAGSVTVPPPITQERWTVQRAFTPTGVPLGLALVTLLAGLGAVGWVVWSRGRDRRYVGQVPGLTPMGDASGPEERKPLVGNPPVVVDFQPPKDMRPGEAGTLLDESADVLDVTVTIVDLAVRRYLKIDETGEKRMFFTKRDWTLTKLKDADDELKRYERTLFDALFKGRDSVTLSGLKETFASDLELVRKELYTQVVADGWFRRRPDSTRAAYGMFGLLVAAVGAGLTYVLARWTHFGLVGIAAVLTGLVLVWTGRYMPAKTGKGSAALAQLLGFRQYIRTAEAEQIRFEEREDIFSRYLPFAIVFGETERWAKAFSSLAGAQTPGAGGGVGTNTLSTLYWYGALSSGGGFDDFNESLSSFTTTTAGSIAAAAPSSGSSGFGGGGGFSGGGFGGGGGGSW